MLGYVESDERTSCALSALAKRMASVSEVGSPSAKSAATFQTHDLSEPMLGWRFMSVVTGWMERDGR